MQDKCVIPVLGWHHSVDSQKNPRGDASRKTGTAGLRDELSPKGADYPYILVMERGDNSGFLAVVSQRMAGYNADAMANYTYELASCLVTLHSAGIIHFDVKLRYLLHAASSPTPALCIPSRTRLNRSCTARRVSLLKCSHCTAVGCSRQEHARLAS